MKRERKRLKELRIIAAILILFEDAVIPKKSPIREIKKTGMHANLHIA